MPRPFFHLGGKTDGRTQFRLQHDPLYANPGPSKNRVLIIIVRIVGRMQIIHLLYSLSFSRSFNQELGGSQSAYSLSDQLKLNPAFNDDSEKPTTFDDVQELVSKMRNEWNVSIKHRNFCFLLK